MSWINQVFKSLSGRPKSGDIIECINPMTFISLLVVAFVIMFASFISNNLSLKFMWALGAVFLSWQAGWGMSIQRFHNSVK
jgi:hypothetical protein